VTQQRLRVDQLRVGAALEFDVFDADGRLLLKRGNRLTSGTQIERLVQEGLFAQVTATPSGGARAPLSDDDLLIDFRIDRPIAGRPNRVSVPGLLGEAARRLEALLAPDAVAPDFALDVRAMAEGIRKCCALDADAALAQVHLSRHIRYAVRQPINVAILVAILAEQLKIEEARASAAVAAALTMNFSMMTLQDILYTRQGALGADEAATLRGHPRAGVLALRERGVLNDTWLQVVEQHHEARDGSGYPAGLKDDAICREAQLLTLADRYCSMVSERAYRPGLAPATVLKELHAKHSTAIDPKLIGLLVGGLGLYPPGVFVGLANGETAIVTGRLLDIRHPVAFALYMNPKMPYESPRKRLTASQPQFAIERVIPRESVPTPIDVEQLWPRTVDGPAPPG
jgi:hypothetical protein